MLERVKKYLSVLELSNCSDAISFQHSKADFLFYNIMEKEIWKDVIGYEGLYQVSNLGRIKSLKRAIKQKNYTRIIKQKILKPLKIHGYSHVHLSVLGKAKVIKIHKLVTSAFLGKIGTGLEINHIDGHKDNNEISNLEYCTKSENAIHAFRLGLRKSGIEHHSAKLNGAQVKEIKESSLSQRKLAKIYGITQSNIWAIKANKTWKGIL